MNWSDEDLFVYVNYDLILITSILNQPADATFAECMMLPLSQAPEIFWKYYASFLLEAWKVESSSSFTNRIHNRLRNNNSVDLFTAFAVIAKHDHTILSLKKINMSAHPDMMMEFFNFYLLDICTFCRLLSLWYWILQNLNPKTWSLRTSNFIFIVLQELSSYIQFNLLVKSSTIWLFKYNFTCCD